MRLWSLHPKFLDARGLVALWREGLLAQAVLRGRTTGYVAHPQLDRFRGAASPAGAIAAYLRTVRDEAAARGYAFDARKIARSHYDGIIPVTRGQVAHEREHLLAKLALRDPGRHAQLASVTHPRVHPLFRVVPGGIEAWERGSAYPAPSRRVTTTREAPRSQTPREPPGRSPA